MTGETTAARPRGRGRPRSRPSDAPGVSTPDEILEAAAALFGSQGFSATTTRQIAEAVGIKQSSLYYHFPDKATILRTLLTSTVTPSVQLAQWLETAGASATTSLCALTLFDLDGLLRDTWNLHVVYRLGDVGGDDYSEAKADQARLRVHYRELSARAYGEQTGGGTIADAEADLPFGLVEGFIGQWQWGDPSERRDYAHAVLRGCLRLVRAPEDALSQIESGARDLLVTSFADVGRPVMSRSRTQGLLDLMDRTPQTGADGHQTTPA